MEFLLVDRELYFKSSMLNIHGKVYAPSVHKVTKVTPNVVK